MDGLSRGKNFTLSYRAGLHTGTLVPDSEAAEELGRLGDTTGRFTKGTLDLPQCRGLGLSYTRPGDWFARFDYARRIGGDELMSRDAASRQRMWFMAGKMF